MPPVVLCVGGLDPSGRAGLLADVRAAEAMGARPLCVATALTFQSSLRADGFEPVNSELLLRQLRPLLDDEPIAAVKVGQLASPENALLLAQALPRVPIVVDTPLSSSVGTALFPADRAMEAYRPLFARASLVTPNLPELRLFTGAEEVDLLRVPDALNAQAVLVKGGHAEGAFVEDVLVTEGGVAGRFRSERVPGRHRGTGCRLASAVAAQLASGATLEEAIDTARSWLVATLARDAA